MIWWHCAFAQLRTLEGTVLGGHYWPNQIILYWNSDIFILNSGINAFIQRNYIARGFRFVVLGLGCCDTKARSASSQTFTLWQQATIRIVLRDHSVIGWFHHLYMGVILRAHSVPGETHIHRNANQEVATRVLG